MAITHIPQSSLTQLLEDTPATALHPLCFFVSWQGVLTIAYRGFPNALLGLKQRINDKWPALPKENPGSLWPKTTLAPLKDGERLTPEQLQTLLSICKRCSAPFQDDLPVPVQSAAVAVFACRSLERCLSVHEVGLRGGTSVTNDNTVTDLERERVRGIVLESESKDYWFAASKDGSRENHYRGAAFGCTVMVPLGGWLLQNGLNLQLAIQHLQSEVDQALPGMYAWLDPSSYHVTIRGIVG